MSAVCPHCDTEKPLSAFYWRRGKPRIREGCKECFCAITYRPTTAEHLAQQKARNDASFAKAEARYRRWSSEDDELLISFWPDASISVDDLAAELGRTVMACQTRVMVLRRAGTPVPDRRTACMKNRPLENA